MEDTSDRVIQDMLNAQKDFFSSHRTKSVEFRIGNLKRFKAAIRKHEKNITNALWEDLHKSYEEAYLTEISLVTQEIDNHLAHLERWSKPKRVHTPIQLLPSSSMIMSEPLGVSLIIAPWNYPFQLLMNPLVGALSAGCCSMLKPSPYTPSVARAIEELIKDTFDEEYIGVVQGGRKVNQLLMEQRFDIIFFTGSPSLGKVVMRAAAEHLTPVVLELGGKSPCIVDRGADIEIAARRIAWGKTINAGQTCIAPDYLFVHRSVKVELVDKIGLSITQMHGEDIRQSAFYPRIVNTQAMNRLEGLMKDGRIVFGGEIDHDEKYIAPTIIDDVQDGHPIMQEEIFGPLLPVMPFDRIEEAIGYVNDHEKPLALYYFGKNEQAREVLAKTTSGGGCINDTLMHITNHHLPFGGVGISGMGTYHGHQSFLAFSNQRAIVHSPTWIDLPFKYAPFKYFQLIKKIL
jgi:aldehyde dehydrogenase (NAD+)